MVAQLGWRACSRVRTSRRRRRTSPAPLQRRDSSDAGSNQRASSSPRSQVSWRLASWRVAGCRARGTPPHRSRRPGAPRPAGSRPRASPAGPADAARGQLGSARSARTSSRKPAAEHRVEAASMRACSTARSRGASTSLSTRNGKRGDATASRLPVADRRPRQAIHLQRALDALRIGGVDARGRGRIDRGQFGMQRRPAAPAASACDLRARRRVGLGHSATGRRSSAWKYSRCRRPGSACAAARGDVVASARARIARRTRPPNTAATARACRSGGAAPARARRASGLAAPMSRPR